MWRGEKQLRDIKYFPQGLLDSKSNLIPKPVIFHTTAQLPALPQGSPAHPFHFFLFDKFICKLHNMDSKGD